MNIKLRGKIKEIGGSTDPDGLVRVVIQPNGQVVSDKATGKESHADIELFLKDRFAEQLKYGQVMIVEISTEEL